MRFGWLFHWEELQTHGDQTSYFTLFGLHLKANRIFFSTSFRGLWIRIFVPAGLSQFPGTLSLFEFAKYIYCQAAFFFSSDCKNVLFPAAAGAGAAALPQTGLCTSLGVPFSSWPQLSLKTSQDSLWTCPLQIIWCSWGRFSRIRQRY